MSYTPAVPWEDFPSTDTPLDAAHLNAAQADLAAYTDALVAAEAASRAEADALKQDAATAATDAELASAVTSLNNAIALKQDASTAATDAELASEASARIAGDALAVAKALVDAKGDLIAGTANDTVARLPVGADGTVLTADAAEAAGVKWAAAAGGGAPSAYGIPGTNQYMTSQFGFGNITASLLNTAIPMALYVGKSFTAKGLGISVNSGGAAGAVIRLGIYNATANGLPGTLLLDAGTADASTGGFKTVTINQLLVPGLYYLVSVAQVATSTQRTFSNFFGPHTPIAADAVVAQTPGQNYYRINPGPTGALPSSPTWDFVGNTNGGQIPMIGVLG